MTSEQEQAFEHWWTTHGQSYEAAVIEAGGTPWTTDMEERRALWLRRYTRPAPPQFLPAVPSLREFNAA